MAVCRFFDGTITPVQLPPWPDMLNGPPDGPGWDNPDDPFGHNPTATGGNNTYYTSFVTTVSATGATVTTVSFPTVVASTTVRCPPESTVAFQTPKTTLRLQCAQDKTFSYGFTCPGTKVITFLGPSLGAYTADCSLVTTFPTSTQDTTTSSSDTEVPVWTTFPPGDIDPITTPVPKAKHTDDGIVVPCSIWFFNLCPKIKGNQIQGWRLKLPPGIIGPGPPPLKPTPYITVHNTLPPWPKITVFPGQDPEIPEEPEKCEEESAEVCGTVTLTITSTVDKDNTKTITTSTTDCETVFGCEVTDSDSNESSTSTKQCKPTATPDTKCGDNILVFLEDEGQVGDVLTILQPYSGKYKQVASSKLTSYIFVESADPETVQKLRDSTYVSAVNYDEPDDDDDGDTPFGPFGSQRQDADFVQTVDEETEGNLTRRADESGRAVTKATHPSIISLARSFVWRSEKSDSYEGEGKDEPYVMHWDPSGGYDSDNNAPWTVFVAGEDGAAPKGHPEWQDIESQLESGPATFKSDADKQDLTFDSHGTAVAAMVNGKTLGTCKRCRVVYYEAVPKTPSTIVDHFTAIVKAVEAEPGKYKNRAIVNLSAGYRVNPKTTDWIKALYPQVRALDNLGVAVVIASGNNVRPKKGKPKPGPKIDSYPGLFVQDDNLMTKENPKKYPPLKNIIVVGATDELSQQTDLTQVASYLTTNGPGIKMRIATYDADAKTFGYKNDGEGTSIAAPQVAGIAAFLRSLNTPWKTQLQNTGSMQRMIRFLSRSYRVRSLDQKTDVKQKKKMVAAVIWNGQVKDKNCLVDWPNRAKWDADLKKACGDLTENIPDLKIQESALSCDSADLLGIKPGDTLKKRADGDDDESPRGCSPDDPNDSDGKTISYTSSGSITSPTCSGGANSGGTLCTGYYCTPRPTGPPPDFGDPNDPNNGLPPPSQSTVMVTKTITTMLTTSSEDGVFEIAAESRLVFPPHGGGGIEMSLYDLNFFTDYPPHVNPCSVGYRDVVASGTPKPNAWSDVPATVEWHQSITSYATHYSNCAFHNDDGKDTGTLSCAQTTVGCSVNSLGFEHQGCNDDALAGYLTKLAAIGRCKVYKTITTVTTITTEVPP